MTAKRSVVPPCQMSRMVVWKIQVKGRRLCKLHSAGENEKSASLTHVARSTFQTVRAKGHNFRNQPFVTSPRVTYLSNTFTRFVKTPPAKCSVHPLRPLHSCLVFVSNAQTMKQSISFGRRLQTEAEMSRITGGLWSFLG